MKFVFVVSVFVSFVMVLIVDFLDELYLDIILCIVNEVKWIVLVIVLMIDFF